MSKVYGYVQERIIEALEKAIKDGGTVPWKKPWNSNGFVNYVTRRPYRGINILLLPEAGEYITWKQIQDIREKNPEVKLKKNYKQHMVVFWRFPDKKEEDSDDVISLDTDKKKPIFLYHIVYNINDVEGIESKFSVGNEHNPIVEAENVISNYNEVTIQISKGSDNAYYSPLKDYISVPDKSQYKNIAEYYSTLFHEMVHSTGHKSRLNRFSTNEQHCFGSESYSKEELVAEIGANMLMSQTGIDDTEYQTNSISYLHGWLKAIKEDVSLIVSAAQKAQKAADYILKVNTN